MPSAGRGTPSGEIHHTWPQNARKAAEPVDPNRPIAQLKKAACAARDLRPALRDRPGANSDLNPYHTYPGRISTFSPM